jgi:O-antigen/teichoic acid export membrane protein
MAIGLLLRLTFLTGMVLIVVAYTSILSDLLYFQQWDWLFKWYLYVSIIRLFVLSISQAMESLLWQKDAQYSLAMGSLIRFVLVFSIIVYNEIDLFIVVIIEGIAELTTLLIIAYRYYKKWITDAERSKGDLAWWNDNKKRVFRFGLLNYLVNQSTLLYGTAPNRILLASYLPPANLAIFGFADATANLTRRFIPTKLLIGFIRPIFMAQYSVNNNFQKLNGMSNYVFRINLSLLMLPIAMLVVVGNPSFDWLTAGKYADAAYILAGLFILIILEGLYALLVLLTQAIEKNQIIIYGNIIKSLSLLAVIPLIDYFGIWSIIIANFSGLLTACIIVIIYLIKLNYPFKLDIDLISLNVFYGVLSGLLGWLVYGVFGVVTASLAIVIIYIVFFIIKPPFFDYEIKNTLKLLSKSIRSRKHA